MKIVSRKVFLAMPAGTLFSKYQPCWFDELTLKGDTWGDDFQVQSIADAVKADSSDKFSAILDDAAEDGKSFDLDFNSYGRDGCFDGPETMFAVWEAKDLRGLIGLLQDALEVATAATPA